MANRELNENPGDLFDLSDLFAQTADTPKGQDLRNTVIIFTTNDPADILNALPPGIAARIANGADLFKPLDGQDPKAPAP